MLRLTGLPPVQLHVGLVASHALVAKYLHDFLVGLDMNVTRVPLQDLSSAVDALMPGTQNVIVLDLHDLPLPVSTYLDVFRKETANSVFLALDHFREVSDIAQLLLCGFSGFLTYEQVPQLLAQVIASVANGETWATPEVMRAYIKLTSRRPALTESGAEILTKREDQIRDLLRKRYSNREIATFLGICESTVKFHVSNVLAKLNAGGRKELTQSGGKTLAQLSTLQRRCIIPPSGIGGSKSTPRNQSSA